MNILLASNNEHKRLEIDGIINDIGVELDILQPRDIGFAFDVEETGETFGENAFLKARALYDLLNGTIGPGVTVSEPIATIRSRMDDLFSGVLPHILADDSGICVPALDNRPGVFSARYGQTDDGTDPGDSGRNQLLLDELHKKTDRSAFYVCNAVLLSDASRYIQVQETWYGEISREPAYGETGFGYDPIFFLRDFGGTVAQIPQSQKNRISHRAKAIQRLTAAAVLLDQQP